MAEVSPNAWRPGSARVCGTVSQIRNIRNLQGVRTNQCRSASLVGLQNEILRYGRLKTCATFRVGPPKEHLRNPGNPWSRSALVLATPGSEFRVRIFPSVLSAIVGGIKITSESGDGGVTHGF
jgi:hypothetical protein